MNLIIYHQFINWNQDNQNHVHIANAKLGMAESSSYTTLSISNNYHVLIM